MARALTHQRTVVPLLTPKYVQPACLAQGIPLVVDIEVNPAGSITACAMPIADCPCSSTWIEEGNLA